jgi:hypothetical protein
MLREPAATKLASWRQDLRDVDRLTMNCCERMQKTVTGSEVNSITIKGKRHAFLRICQQFERMFFPASPLEFHSSHTPPLLVNSSKVGMTYL